MADVDIIENKALEILNKIKTKRNALDDAYGNLSIEIGKMDSSWKSNGLDKESYLKELKDLSTRLDHLASSINSLEISVQDHLDDLRQGSMKTMS